MIVMIVDCPTDEDKTTATADRFLDEIARYLSSVPMKSMLADL